MKRMIYHILGLTIWLFILTKLFIFDIDTYLLNSYAPGVSWLISYKLILFLSLIIVSWLLLGNSEFGKAFSFILFYPVILLFWSIPFSLIKRRRWFLVFTYLSGFISTITNFKKNLILVALFLISSAFILNSNNEFASYTSAVVLLLISFFILIRKVYFAFTPSSIFAINTKTIVSFLEKNNLGEKLLENNSNEGAESKSELIENTEITKIEKSDEIPYKFSTLILTNRVLTFLSRKLRRFKESRVYIVFFIISLLFTFAVSVVLFGLINYGIYKLNPASFAISGQSSYFLFLYYSFNALIMNSISAIEPKSFLAMLINMTQIVYGIVLIIILIGIIVSVNTDKYRNDIDEVIGAFDSQSEDVAQVLELNFKITLQQAIKELIRLKHYLIYFFEFLEPDQQ